MNGLLTGRRILIVEDEMLVLMQIEMTLQELGCSAICASAKVTEALALVAKRPFDAAILDVNLGGRIAIPLLTRWRDLASRLFSQRATVITGIVPTLKIARCSASHIPALLSSPYWSG